MSAWWLACQMMPSLRFKAAAAVHVQMHEPQPANLHKGAIINLPGYCVMPSCCRAAISFSRSVEVQQICPKSGKAYRSLVTDTQYTGREALAVTSSSSLMTSCQQKSRRGAKGHACC